MARNMRAFLHIVIGSVTFLVLCQFHRGNARRTGAPSTACNDLIPSGHTGSAQTTASPYTISVSPAFYQAGQNLTVTISTNANSPALKGILLQVRRDVPSSANDPIIGTWSVGTSTDFQLLECNGANSAVTHTNRNDKPSNIQFTWTAPDVDGDDIYVTATFVQSFSTYWVAERTSNIQVVDLCSGNICQNGANCLPLPGAIPPYTCQCPTGFTGRLCDTVSNQSPCNPNPCLNGGGCSTRGDTGYTCDCPSTHVGINCETLVQTGCNNNPCLNGGACTPSGASGYSCTCPSGYTGTNCQTVVQTGCNSNPCLNGGACTPSGASGYSCTCPSGYTGTNCQTPVTPSGDNIPPVVTNCPPDIIRTVPTGTEALLVSWTEPTASDNVGIRSLLSNVPSGTNFPADTTTTVQYTATDLSGNTDTSCSFTVKVTTEVDITPPTVEGCPTDIVVTVNPGTASRAVTWNEPTATDDASGVASLLPSAPSGTSFPTDTTTTVVYLAVDNQGNEDRSCQFTVQIISSENGADIVPPVVTNCPADIILTASPGQDNIVVTWVAPTASDPSGVRSLTTNIQPGTALPVGFTTTVIYTAVDNFGNSDTSCRFTVTLSSQGASVDTTPPTVTNCPADITQFSPPGQASMAVTWVAPTASDPSGIRSLTPNIQPGTVLPVGLTTTVIYTATDNFGNSDTSCRFTVTISSQGPTVDTTPPTVTNCPPDLTVNASPGVQEWAVLWSQPTASDASGISSITSSPASGSPLPVGLTTTVTFIVTDNAGNVDTSCRFAVTVASSVTTCEDNPCKNGATCTPPINSEGYLCTCAVGWSGDTCEMRNWCDPDPCQNGGMCSFNDEGTNFVCDCGDEYLDDVCTITNHCLSGPCKNNRPCTNNADNNGFVCDCGEEFLSETCEIINHCEGDPCQNGRPCSNNDENSGFVCNCGIDYVGDACEYGNFCKTFPCKNGATCSNNADNDGFECDCDGDSGFTGPTCEDPIIPPACDSDPCKNGAECNEENDGFVCECTNGWMGPTCETQDYCRLSPCKNGGVCSNDDENTDFVCNCRDTGYTGPTCEEIDLSTESPVNCEGTSPCQNGALCIFDVCICQSGYTGTFCENVSTEPPIEGCGGPLPCDNGARCLSNVCVCQSGFTGKLCETTVDGVNDTREGQSNLLIDPWWIALICLIAIMVFTLIGLSICTCRTVKAAKTKSDISP